MRGTFALFTVTLKEVTGRKHGSERSSLSLPQRAESACLGKPRYSCSQSWPGDCEPHLLITSTFSRNMSRSLTVS